MAKIEANVAGVDDSIMLDLNGFVSETNATNLFLFKNNCLVTPHADSCLAGITRSMVLEIARSADIDTTERNISLSEVYAADEVFTTGTMGELSPVLVVDGRIIGDQAGTMTRKLQMLYNEATTTQGEILPF